MDIKKHIVEASGMNPQVIVMQVQDNPFEIAERFRESFPYLMEVPVQDSDYKQIEKFDIFIARKLQELESLKSELRAIHAKCVTEYRAEGKLIQKVTYQSLYYHLKMTSEALGIKPQKGAGDFMNLQCTPLHQKVFALFIVIVVYRQYSKER